MNLIKKVTVTTITRKDILMYEGTPVLKYSIEYPEFSSREYARAVKKMNRYYRNMALDYQKYVTTSLLQSAITDYKERIKNGYPFHGHEAVQTFAVTYNQHCVLSLYMDRYEYSGGAHGSTVRTSQTWSLGSGRQLPLKALFPDNIHYIADLKAEINRQIQEQMKNGTGAYFENYRELVDKTFNPQSFYLQQDALAIYFQQYDIAPYSSGIPVFMIPYDAVHAKLPYCRG